MPEGEVPPEYLWEDPEGLDQWWTSVKAKREDGMPTVSGHRGDDDDDDESVMVQNDLATFARR